MEVERGADYDSQRAQQRALIEELRRRFPSAVVSEGEHFELSGGRWRAIPVVSVEFPSGDQMVFFAERPVRRGRGEATPLLTKGVLSEPSHHPH